MFKNEIPQRKKVILFTLLIVLNIVLRIPSIPHEKGADSFFIHSLSNSVTSFGFANWWVHWLSVFGYYPYSYASAIPFALSGLSQISGLETEITILIFCIIMGLFSIFSAYLLAGVLYEEFIFKYLMAFFYSISPSIMFFSTWELSSRGPFIIFLPVFIYIIIKIFQNPKHILLLIVTTIFLFSIHHLAIIIVPMILLFVAIKIISKTKLKKSLPIYFNFIYIIGLAIAFLLPFFDPSMISITGSRYGWIIYSITISIRYIGPMIIFILGGLSYLIFSNNKKINIWYIMCMIIIYVPFIYDQTYGIYIAQLFLIVPIVVGFRNILNLQSVRSSKLIGIFIVLMLISSVMFTNFYNHYRTGKYKDFWYMDDKTYTTGGWINDNIYKKDRILFVTENYYQVRSSALQKNGSSILIGDTEGLTYGFIDKDFIKNLEKVPVTDSYFFSESPYRMTDKDIYRSIDWYISNKNVKQIKEVYKIDYIVQSMSYKMLSGLSDGEKGKIFSNGVLEIYDLY